jgi:bifunctional DNA-binding transcriptional regulator/antitoxin component of YhaV-PrlF toxin-antitoxin module
VIPIALRKKYGITEKTQINVYEEDGKIILEPITPQYIRQIRGVLKGTRALEMLLEERADEKLRENRQDS